MIDDRSLELVHGSIDGENSAREDAELRQRLDSDPELRAIRDQLLELHETLDRVEPVDPPPGLRQAILEAIRPKERRRILRDLLPSWPAPLVMRYGMVAGLGAAVATVALQLAPTDRLQTSQVSDLVGTMASHQPHHDGAGARILLDSKEISGSISGHRQDGLVVVDFDLVMQQPVEIVASFGKSGLRFNGFAQLDDAHAAIESEGGRLVISQERGHRYAVFFSARDERDAAIDFRFLLDGRPVHEEALSLPARN